MERTPATRCSLRGATAVWKPAFFSSSLYWGNRSRLAAFRASTCGLRLGHGGAGLEPGDVRVVVAVALGVRLLLGGEGERAPQHGSGSTGWKASDMTPTIV